MGRSTDAGAHVGTPSRPLANSPRSRWERYLHLHDTGVLAVGQPRTREPWKCQRVRMLVTGYDLRRRSTARVASVSFSAPVGPPLATASATQ